LSKSVLHLVVSCWQHIISSRVRGQLVMSPDSDS
jgi:hypothetical protein